MATGKLSTAGQHDWLAVNLVANQAYQFTFTGLTDFASVEVAAAGALDDGEAAFEVQTTPGASPQTQTVWFEPATSGTYYVDVSDPATIGAYTVSAKTVPADFTDNATTTGVVTVGGPASNGTLSTAGQHDWLAVNLVANQAYQFTFTGLTDFASVEVAAAGALDDGEAAFEVQTTPGASPQTQTVWFEPRLSGTDFAWRSARH